MPRTRSLAWSELKIGIIAAGAIVLATLLIIAVGGSAGFSWQRYKLKTKFTDVMGIKSGAPVRVAGVEVGKVTDVEFAGAEVEIVLEVKKEMQPRITTDSRASIGSLSLLGEPLIDVSPSATGTPLKDGDYIQSTPTKGQIADVAAQATESLETANLLLQDIRAGKGTVGKLFTDEKLYRDFNAFVASADAVAAGIQRGEGTLGQFVKNPSAYRRFEAAAADLQDMTRRLRAGEGSLGKFLTDEAMAKSVTSATANIDSITRRLDKGEGTFGKLLTEKELYERINATVGRLDKLVAGLDQGEGAAGQFMKNKELYENMNSTVKEVRDLIAEIKKDPKKYLTVRVSIF
jgi:phospholipid/cholesterol/gamma-HCH transport system substrate-binding protein